ncbi:hypothetical protein IV487_01825 [Enterococcus saccharolyticus]|uniref:hypothetical protein n=1 Tax=Enterococcus saccharolyticus TaxID=41997 RepID=UPI001E416B1F|nr:hypothetical protein [Enterococcus saccharolyticus]MCD5001202.1 hypothetical protein [Enterococcus saccharolyticus]
MRKRDNPEAWNELLKSMSQGEWKKAKKIVKDNEFYPRERDGMWRNTWIVTTPKGERLTFRTAKQVAKGLRTSQSTVTKAYREGVRVKGYTITRVQGDKR